MPGVTTTNQFRALERLLTQAVQLEVNESSLQCIQLLQASAPTEIDAASVYLRTPTRSGYRDAVARVTRLVRAQLAQVTLVQARLGLVRLVPAFTEEVPRPGRWQAFVASCLDRSVAEFGGKKPGDFWFLGTAATFHPDVGTQIRRLFQHLQEGLG